jgi:crotonobetainyl-CoA:carnitine CoA-transferase CaiB-like acyl-CoA transferase
MAARGFFVQAEHAKAGRLDYATAGYKMSETPCKVQRTAPLLGEHNTYVYCERLGYDRRELAAMMAGGII